MIDRIECGDCAELIKQLPDESIDLIVTDPPYAIETRGAGMYLQHDKRYIKELIGMDDGFNMAMLDEFCRVMKKINIYLFCSQKQILPLLEYFVTGKKCNYNLIAWHKTNPVPACGNKYLTDTEFILFFRERGVRLYGDYNSKKTFYVSTKNVTDKHKYGHPTIKPVEMVKNFILNSSLEGETVLDPFLGSGTTAVAAKELGRHYIGYEISQEYYKISQKRLEKQLTST